MIDDEQKHDQPEDEPFYVGAPTEYADAQEMPGCVQNAIKVAVAVPALVAALSVFELIAVCVIAVIVALVMLFFVAL